MGRKKNKTKQQGLPISKCKAQILESVQKHQVTIITGQTGCGKSTQVPKYLYENGYAESGIIVCLHPRCVAAITLATRVAEELQSDLGALVGYQVRFFSLKSAETKIIFMTMGFLLQLMKFDNQGNRYSVIIIDEAHERSIHTDVILGKTKQMIASNDKLKIIVMSATLDIQEIADFYGACGVVNVPQTADRVTVIYRPLKSSDYVASIRELVEEILRTTATGHVLIFLPSEQKVFRCRQLLKNLPGTRVLPFFSSLDEDDKQAVFLEYGRRRKLIVATNVAETSLTIAGVGFVIDSGFVKRVRFEHATGVERWITEPVSVAEAEQRKGRTGRTGPGVCYRLYDECRVAGEAAPTNPHRFREWADPEILRADLGSLVLALAALRCQNVFDFPFVVAPRPLDVANAAQMLADLSLFHDNGRLMSGNRAKIHNNANLEPIKDEKVLGNPYCVPSNDGDVSQLCDGMTHISLHPIKDENIHSNGDGIHSNDPDIHSNGHSIHSNSSNCHSNGFVSEIRLTTLGEGASGLPVDPRFAKVIVVAKERLNEAEFDDVLAIVAMQSVRSIATGRTVATDAKDDLLTCRDVFWAAGGGLRRGPTRQACMEIGVDYSPIRYAWRVFRQLRSLPALKPTSGAAATTRLATVAKGVNAHDNAVKKAFLAGFFDHVAVRSEHATGKQPAKFVGNGSSLHDDQKEMLLSRLSRLDPDADIALFMKLQKPADRDELQIRICTGLNRDMMLAIDPKKFRIKTHLWHKVLDAL